MAYETQLSMKTNHWKSWQISKRQIKLDLLLDYAGTVQIYQNLPESFLSWHEYVRTAYRQKAVRSED